MDCNELYDEDDFWIGARYDGRVIDMAELGSWQIDTKLSEKATCSATPEEGGIAQATAVYYCHRVDEGTPDVAVIKIHKQYCQQLTGSRPHIDARCRIQTLVDLDQDLPKQGLTPDTVPTKELHHFARKELNCLQTLTKEDCKYSPKLYGYLCDTQQPDDWVPGGYVLYLLMERLPGISVDSWMDLPSSEEEDEQLRCALGAALTELERLGYYYHDASPRNALGDDEKGQCFIVDYETAFFRPRGVRGCDRWQRHFYKWGLPE